MVSIPASFCSSIIIFAFAKVALSFPVIPAHLYYIYQNNETSTSASILILLLKIPFPYIHLFLAKLSEGCTNIKRTYVIYFILCFDTAYF